MNGRTDKNGNVTYIRTDHIGRPVFATDATGAKVWEVSYLPFGGVHVATGANIDLRFPGQWFQSESGLHQNWMRDYDPTTGRYMQADPLGLVDGASVYGYARQNPGRYVDPRGEETNFWEIARGYGSYWRGLSRCLRYCNSDDVEKTLQALWDSIQANPGLNECLKLFVLKQLKDNPSFVTGRALGGQTAGALTLFGTRGRSLITRGGISGSVSLGTGFVSGIGDLGYKINRFGGASAANIIADLLQLPKSYSLEGLGCQCQEYLRAKF